MPPRTRTAPPSIGATIHRLRTKRELTLDELSRSSGVSKSMLSQIERDQTNPTIATVWRLANALGVTLEDVLRGDEVPRGIEVVRLHGAPTLTSADGRCFLRILSPVSMAGQVEWYELSTEPEGALVSESHEPGTMEHLSVFEGRLTVESGAQSMEVAAGETARYPADQRHAIRNASDAPARALLVVAMASGRR